MGDCRLNDPGVLARWLDGSLDPSEVRAVDRHLLDGCTVCWSVLRFVGRLRELVGRAETSGPTRAVPHVLLDSEAIRTAIGLAPRSAEHRELLLELGPWEALIELTTNPGTRHPRFEMLAIDRLTFDPPPEPISVEIRREADVVARGATGPDGRLTIPVVAPGSLRLEFRGPGLASVSVDLEL